LSLKSTLAPDREGSAPQDRLKTRTEEGLQSLGSSARVQYGEGRDEIHGLPEEPARMAMSLELGACLAESEDKERSMSPCVLFPLPPHQGNWVLLLRM
jgi:hypothetical protein